LEHYWRNTPRERGGPFRALFIKSVSGDISNELLSEEEKRFVEITICFQQRLLCLLRREAHVGKLLHLVLMCNIVRHGLAPAAARMHLCALCALCSRKFVGAALFLPTRSCALTRFSIAENASEADSQRKRGRRV